MPKATTSPVQTKNEQILNPANEADVANAIGQQLEKIANGTDGQQPAADQQPPTPAEVVIPEYLKPILAARHVEDAANVATAAKLDEAFIAAKRLYVQANLDGNFAQTPEVIAASEQVKLASEAIELHAASVKLLDAQRAESDDKLKSKYVLCEAFGCSLEKIEQLLEASKSEKDTLKPAFTAVFGRPVVRLDNKTGKNVAAKAASQPTAEGEVSRETKPAAGDKWAEATEALASGLTYDELLQRFPTHGSDGVINYKKLNGTVRTVISKDGWVKQADGTYKVVAE